MIYKATENVVMFKFARLWWYYD